MMTLRGAFSISVCFVRIWTRYGWRSAGFVQYTLPILQNLSSGMSEIVDLHRISEGLTQNPTPAEKYKNAQPRRTAAIKQ